MSNIDAKVSEAIGLRPSMVYKIRKGHRFPSFNTMLKIENATNWSVSEQTNARRLGLYGQVFEKVFTTGDSK